MADPPARSLFLHSRLRPAGRARARTVARAADSVAMGTRRRHRLAGLDAGAGTAQRPDDTWPVRGAHARAVAAAARDPARHLVDQGLLRVAQREPDRDPLPRV